MHKALPTSPAAEAKPEMHLATSSSLNELTLAVHASTANNSAVDISIVGRLPYLTEKGTQIMLPTPRSRKFNWQLTSSS
jgi:hypothetical protein